MRVFINNNAYKRRLIDWFKWCVREVDKTNKQFISFTCLLYIKLFLSFFSIKKCFSHNKQWNILNKNYNGVPMIEVVYWIIAIVFFYF